MKYYLYLILTYSILDASSLYITKKYGKFGVIDSNGNLLIKHSYEKIYPFNKNLHAIVKNYNGKFGVIDNKNKIVLDIIYKKIYKFKHKLAIIQINNKFGLVDKLFNIVLKANYHSIHYDHNDLVYLENNNAKFTISKDDILKSVTIMN